jgi:hypothetical protein
MLLSAIEQNTKYAMKYILHILLLIALAGCASKYSAFQFDNGNDYIQDGLYRIVDNQGLIGYANQNGTVVIKPQFAFGFPFEGGKAKVTNTGKSKEVTGSHGEHYYWDSNDWFYIDKGGNRIR